MTLSPDKKTGTEMNSPARRVAFLGIFLALALILSYVETLIPLSYTIPGMKLGLANLAVVCALYYFGTKEAFAISVLRILIVGVLFGTGYSLIYSLCGGILSFLAMIVIKRFRLSVVSISLTGGICHNIGQLIAAAFLLNTVYITYYLPALMIAGALTGAAIGILAGIIVSRVSLDFGRS